MKKESEKTVKLHKASLAKRFEVTGLFFIITMAIIALYQINTKTGLITIIAANYVEIIRIIAIIILVISILELIRRKGSRISSWFADMKKRREIRKVENILKKSLEEKLAEEKKSEKAILENKKAVEAMKKKRTWEKLVTAKKTERILVPHQIPSEFKKPLAKRELHKVLEQIPVPKPTSPSILPPEKKVGKKQSVEKPKRTGTIKGFLIKIGLTKTPEQKEAEEKKRKIEEQLKEKPYEKNIIDAEETIRKLAVTALDRLAKKTNKDKHKEELLKRRNEVKRKLKKR